jgi:preprotein translocase subunit SecA
MVDAIAEDFVKYVMHLEVVRDDVPATDVRNLQTTGPDAVQGAQNIRAAAALAPVEDQGMDPGPAPVPDVPLVNVPVVKDEHDKVGRNDPCWCGSGKKFKHCHGR